jgi:hypothetical protein
MEYNESTHGAYASLCHPSRQLPLRGGKTKAELGKCDLFPGSAL